MYDCITAKVTLTSDWLVINWCAREKKVLIEYKNITYSLNCKMYQRIDSKIYSQ